MRRLDIEPNATPAKSHMSATRRKVRVVCESLRVRGSIYHCLGLSKSIVNSLRLENNKELLT